MSTLARYCNYIDGAWKGADTWLGVTDPATDAPYAEIADADAAMVVARRCVNSNALTSVRPAQRVTWLLAIAEEIKALTKEAAMADKIE